MGPFHCPTFMRGPALQADNPPSVLMKLVLFEAGGGSVCQGFGPSFDLFFLWSSDLHSLSDKVRKCLGEGEATPKGRDITHVEEATRPG